MAPRKSAVVKSDDVEAPKLSKFELLKKDALKDHTFLEPYVLDDTVDPPLVIEAPEGLEAQTLIASMVDADGQTVMKYIKPMLAAVCGKSFDRVWDLVKDEPIEVAEAVLQDIWEHFDAAVLESAKDAPGKEPA